MERKCKVSCTAFSASSAATYKCHYISLPQRYSLFSENAKVSLLIRTMQNCVVNIFNKAIEVCVTMVKTDKHAVISFFLKKKKKERE